MPGHILLSICLRIPMGNAKLAKQRMHFKSALIIQKSLHLRLRKRSRPIAFNRQGLQRVA